MEDDLTQEILFGTPDMTAEEEQQMQLQAEQTAQDMQIMESMARQQALQQEAAAQQPQRSQQQSAQPTGQAQQQEEPKGDRNIVQQAFDALAAPGQGVNDWFVDTINLLPGVELRKAPKFQNDVTQGLREVSSVVLPTIFLTKGMGSGLQTAATASRVKMFNDPFLKFVAPKLLGAGVGAGVDYAVEFNQTDDNLSGTLKKAFPSQFGWIPDDIATLDSDSPDIKRAKNVSEGVGIGLFVDVAEGMGKLVKGIRGVVRSTQWVPESEKATQWFSKNLKADVPNDIEEAIAESAARRSDALDELGEYNFSKNANLDQPMLGVHDLYGYEESGIRSVDDLGIVGAAVDVARIVNNADSVYGRVGSVISEPALKFGLEVPEGMESIVKGLASQLQEAGEYGYRTASGKYLSHKEIMQAGEDLAMDFYKMDTPELQRAIKNWQGIDVDTGAPVLKSEAYAAVFKTINRYMDDFANMDVMRAQAYVGTSFAGQVSDMAQGVRLMDGTAAIERAEEQILDRLEFLMAQKGMTSYSRGRALNMLNLWNRLTVKGSEAADAGYATKINNAIKGEENATLQAIERIKGEAKQTINTLREIKAERPEMLAPLMMAYEFTDGKVDTISKLNNYVRSSLGVFSKAFFDGEPEIPSAVMRGFWSNVYNSTLSAIGTPIKAGVSNIALLAERPIAQAAGAIINGDGAIVRKGWYQYSAAWDTLTNSLGYMNQVFRRSASEPYVMALREDMGVADRQQIELLKQFADAKAESGEYGPQIMMSIVEAQNDLAQHPWLRFGQRGMQAFDGFTQAVVANWEARGKAWDTVTKGGLIPLDKKASDQLSKEVYSAMFDENDNITDSAVRYASSEISMALDNPANDALSGLIRTAPILKPFLLFTKTPLNMATYFGSHNPVGMFIDKVNAFDKEFFEMSGQEVEQLLSSRGIDYSMESIESVYNTVRAELKGRKAIGTLAVMGAIGLFMSDNLSGDGLYDKEKQRLRRDANWQPRSIRVPGGQWVSYDGIPGVSDWVALTANIMDNFDSLNSAELAENLRAAGFVLSATITDKSMLAALEPLNDVVRGDVGAINRWTSSFASSAAMPGSSLMAEFGRLITPNKKELENNFFDLVANRNPIMKQALPDAHDWIDGGLVGEPPNFFARVWNTYLPWKVNGEVSPEKQFLMDIEYDARPTLKTNGRGVEYSNEERSEVTSMMGKQQIFKREIQRIMQTEEGNVFRKEFKKARDMGLQPEVEKFKNIHLYLDAALRSSMRYAEAQVSTRDGIQQKVYKNQTVENFLQVGDLDGAKRFLDNMNRTMSY
jgi:hypothetical protein